MASHDGDNVFNDEWPPPPEAVRSVRWPSTTGPVVALLSHLSAPYWETGPSPGDEKDLQRVAYRYLRAACDLNLFELEDAWLPALDPDAAELDIHFGWMPIGDRRGSEIQVPLASLDASDDGDKLVVLFAAQRIGDRFLGSEFGLRVALRWRPFGAQKFLFSITGASATLPFGPYKEHPARISASEIEAYQKLLFDPENNERMADLSGLRRESIRLRGVRISLKDGMARVERKGVGSRRDAHGVDLPYAVSTITVGKVDKVAGEADTDHLQHRSLFIADAKGRADVFLATPAPNRDCRPRRDEGKLRPDRRSVQIEPNANTATLADSHLQVLPSKRFVLADKNAATPLQVPTPGTAGKPPVRGNVASAIQSFWHARDLVRRMEAYHLDPDTYFQLIHPVIDIAYRSGVSPGPGKDGQSVNARVQPKGWPPDFMGPIKKDELPVVQLHLSLADRARRERNVQTPGGPRQPALPMGIGADPRWMWHEFGHLLTLASTGELELRFAHSPGDALAAIVGDPELKLGAHQGKWRGATFPWVFLPRRHDRCVLHGWSWCGSLHRQLAESDANLHPRRKGYQSEQILSTSLFRIYRCIGGDTRDAGNPVAATEKRLEASHYTCFLVMKALQILGDAQTTPSQMPDQYEQALFDADLYLANWNISYRADTAAAKPYARVGGCTTKVIRWCFEAQGLHAPGTTNDFDCPGAPEPVDIFVKSRRPDTDPGMDGLVSYGPGSYVPVSLHWKTHPAEPESEWQADPADGIIWDQGAGQITVKVGNRGTSPARGVTVSAWAIAWPANAPAPAWKKGGGGAWARLSPYTSAPDDIGPRQSKDFGPFDLTPLPSGRHIIMAASTCPGDRPYIELPTHAPSFTDCRLVDLVAGDNNLGLLVIDIP
jgi:hypothetical protein